MNITRKKIYFILSILFAFALTACNSDQDMPQLSSSEHALMINSRAFIGGLRSLEVSADYTDLNDTDRRKLSIDWQSDTWNNTDNKPILLISVGDEVYEVPSGNYDYNSKSSIHIAYQIKYSPDDNEVRFYLCDKSHYDKSTKSLMFEDQNKNELMPLNFQDKKAFNFIFTSTMTINDIRDKKQITFKPLGTILLFDAEVLAGENKQITIASDCFDMGCKVNLKTGKSEIAKGQITKTYKLKRGATDKSIYGIYCISQDKINGSIILSGIKNESKTYTIGHFSEYSGKFVNLSTKDDTPEVRPSDDDWYTSVWQGNSEIRYYDIDVNGKLYSEYREKGSSDWIIYDAIPIDNEFIINGLDPQKTYEVRLFGMTRLRANSENLKLVTQWGKTKWGNNNSFFADCTEMDVTANDTPDLSICTDLSNMFSGCINLEGNEKFNDWDVSNIENMASMFESASKFNQPLSNWNVSKVNGMDFMFYDATAFSQNISMWPVTIEEPMFGFCEGSGIENKPDYKPRFIQP